MPETAPSFSLYTECPVERIMAYPYPRPDKSYIYYQGSAYPLLNLEPQDLSQSTFINGLLDPLLAKKLQDLEFKSLHPVLAVGSNASPQQLARKFRSSDEIIPVIRTRVCGFDVFYAAQLASYGAIPATLDWSERTTADLFITFLSDTALTLMHETEEVGFNYDYIELNEADMKVEFDIQLERIFTYISRTGTLYISDERFAIDMIPATNRTALALSQTQIFETCIAQLGIQCSARECMTQLTQDAQLMQTLSSQIRSYGRGLHSQLILG